MYLIKQIAKSILNEKKRARTTPCNQHAFPAPHSGGERTENESVRSQSFPSSGSLLQQPYTPSPLPHSEDNRLLPTGKAGCGLLLRRCTDVLGNGCQKKSFFHSTSRLIYYFHYPLEQQWKPTYVFRHFWSRSHTDSHRHLKRQRSSQDLCANATQLNHKRLRTPLNAFFAK